MAIRFDTRIPVSMELVFPHGVFLAPGSEVTKSRDFNRSTRENFVQAKDEDTGLDLWSVVVIDGDPEILGARDKSVEVVIPAKNAPAMPGGAFTSVTFDNLTAKGKVNNQGMKGRLVWEYRATSVRALNGAKPAPPKEG